MVAAWPGGGRYSRVFVCSAVVILALSLLQISYIMRAYYFAASAPLFWGGGNGVAGNSRVQWRKGKHSRGGEPAVGIGAATRLDYHFLLANGSNLTSESDGTRNRAPLTSSPSSLHSHTPSHSVTSVHNASLYATTYYNPAGPTWKKGSFCESFVERTFQLPVAVCGPELSPEHSIKCYKNTKSKLMVYCILESVFMSGPRAVGSKPAIGLLTGDERTCPSLSLSTVHKTSEKNSQAQKLLDKVAERERKQSSICEEWINKTVFLYLADQPVHIYFRMNAYYNLHKAISREGVAPGDFIIIRYATSSTYLFAEWESTKLFPEMVDISELPNKTLCFRKLVVVPHSFAGILFRCKMESNVRGPCFECKGRGLYGTSLYSFRERVLTSCGLIDEKDHTHTANRITIVSRTPYQRWRKDNPQKFQRVLGNEKELVKSLKSAFPNTNVTVAHMEKMDICQQVFLAHDARVVTGVHGAGLVHLWWLPEDSLALELNPTFEMGNPTFKMLSTLTGRNYASVTAPGSQHEVKVDVSKVISLLKSKAHLS